MNTYTQSDVLRLLREKQGKRTLRDFAKVIGVSVAYLSDIFLLRRNPGPAILKYLELRQERIVSVTYYEEK
jgi:transcriptional regulator with XRE-family HTH domain